MSANSSEEPTSSDQNSSSSNKNTKRNEKNEEMWGYDLFPERKGAYKPSMGSILVGMEGRETIDKFKCEKNVYKCVMKSPLVQLMMNALKSSGCEIDIRRHITCEVCDISVSGGYDPELNQIVVCQNSARSTGFVQGVLAHEMIHMFDYCRRELDFKNMEHLACTEIRAANLTHCSFLSAWSQGDANFTKVKKAHEDCVKTKALYSVLSVRQIAKEEAVKVIDKVFPVCYADLEPIGRRIKSNSRDMHRAYIESILYGYN
ncbi:mitochondrial inner membrane protease ATP23 homolog [Arctopsyche grandis]|uniref:mitochondrial inner membrane protease ATP23 homolog n=1 Tax=Arctopsyche grandis TaxID=121162 RepID=UPI00406DA489